MNKKIFFNKPYMTGNEIEYLRDAHSNRSLAGDGPYTKKCNQWIEKKINCKSALLTHSCTAALEMSALLIDINPGDEVIMPSYTFVSTANAFVLRGGVPVFVDIRYDTLNLNETLIEEAISEKTKAIVPVHYAGVSCEMDRIMNIAREKNLFVIEDAAQGTLASYKGRLLGSIGDLAAYSFHETKNLISGEGGALLINDEKFISRAEIIREKGTDRSSFHRGEIDKYTWQDVGSSFLPSEIIASFLYAQLECAEEITRDRKKSWDFYHNNLKLLEERGNLRLPIIPQDCDHNGHMYYILVSDTDLRDRLIQYLKDNEIYSVFHYIPLHSSPAGKKYCKMHGNLETTNRSSESLVRLPLWKGISLEMQTKVVDCVDSFFKKYA